MYVIAPESVTDAVLAATNLAEADQPAWASGTTYAVGARVMVVTASLAKSTSEAWAAGQAIHWSQTLGYATTTVIAGARIGHASAAALAADATGSVSVHGVYESLVGGNLGVQPVSDVFAAVPKWVKVGATNRWKPFDGTISDPAVNAGDITYDLTLPGHATGLALFGLVASTAKVEVRDLSNVLVYSETRSLTNTEDIIDWYTFYMWDPVYASEALFTGLPGYAGYKVSVTVGGTNVRVGEIALGKVVALGTSLAGTEIGFEDYSRKDRDDFGNVVLVERGYADTVNFQFAVPITDLRRVKRVVADLRATPAVWFAGEALIDRGATLYGFPAGGLRVPLSLEGRHFASLEIEGLT